MKQAQDKAQPRSRFRKLLLEAFDRKEDFAVTKILSTTGEVKKSYSETKIELGLDCSPTMAQKKNKATILSIALIKSGKG